MPHRGALRVFRGFYGALIVVCALACLSRSINAQTMVESRSETRFSGRSCSRCRAQRSFAGRL